MRLELNGNLDEESSPKARGQRRMMETWIVLELCNRGSLQVTVLLVLVISLPADVNMEHCSFSANLVSWGMVM